MQMVTGGNACASSQTDLLTGTDDGAITDAESAAVHINRLYNEQTIIELKIHKKLTRFLFPI